MENNILTTQLTQPETPALPTSKRAADILLQEMQLLLDQSKLACEPDNAMNLGPNEKARILCAMAEAITSGACTITELEKARNHQGRVRRDRQTVHGAD